MKLTVSKNDLWLATNRCQGGISDKTQAQIGLKSSGNQLTITCSDRVLAVYCSIPCRQDSPDDFVFTPAKMFADVVRELPEGDVDIHKNDSHLVITAGPHSEFQMKLPKIDERVWKDPPMLTLQNAATLPTTNISYLIDQIQFCVSHEATRNYGAVGYFHKTDKNKLRLVGSDGFRLSFAELNIDLPEGFLENGVCITKRGLTEMARMCSEGVENISLAISEDKTTLLTEIPNYRLYIRLAAVKYPIYERVLPKQRLNPVVMSRSHVQSVTKRVLLAADKNKALQLQFNAQNLTLYSKTLGSSEGKESISLADYDGDNKELALNGRFLADIFATIPYEGVVMSFNDAEDPVTIVPLNEPEHCSSMHVLVPIRESE